jgi:translin
MLEDLDSFADSIRQGLDQQDQAREQAFGLSRQIIRAASMAIKAIHRQEREAAHERLAECRELVHQMQEALAATPSLRYGGFVGDAEKEYAEAAMTIACIERSPLPGPQELGVDGAAWLNGLAEAGGEFRRHVLDSIRDDDLEEGMAFLAAMQEAYDSLMGFDYPSAIDRGLRGRTDALRGMLERTRGDLTSALRQARLEQRLREVEESLSTREAEGT